ncbi:histidine phosphotransferase family protein [Rhodovulum sp. DZ06]|uniref:histidine phosphotransferase family protein n=1 Tax=Rhodovulum sp. DZ06 TaxID=3425126 RepID=UPI003D344E9A
MNIADPTLSPDAGLAPIGPAWLASLVSSRICHDLISPVGAVCNGVELIEEFGAAGDQEMALIGDSARSAAAQLQLFRTAFGAGAHEAEYSLDQLRKVLDGRFAAERAGIAWRLEPGRTTTRLGARLCALGTLGAAAALPRGGDITLSEPAPHTLQVAASGPMLRIDPDAPLWTAGKPGGRAPEPRDVHWLAARAFAQEGGAALALTSDEAALTFTIALPEPKG